MRLLSIIILTMIFNSTFGQKFQNDSIINKFIKNLSDNGVDTVLIYENGCIGCETLIALENKDSCFYYGKPQTSYIFWKFSGLTYVNMISNFDCNKYDTIVYDIGFIWDLYFKNKFVIKKERILPPSYIDKTDTFLVDIDHYFYVQIMVLDKKEKLGFVINDFYFDKMIDKKHMNMNFVHNSKTFRRKLQIQLDKEIVNIEDNKLIIKTAYNTVYAP